MATVMIMDMAMITEAAVAMLATSLVLPEEVTHVQKIAEKLSSPTTNTTATATYLQAK